MAMLTRANILEKLVDHIEKQRGRAGLVGEPFILGVATDIKPSLVFEVIDENFAALEKIGMKKYEWLPDALRSKRRIAGEELLISIHHY